MSRSRTLAVRSLIAAATAGLAVVTPLELLPILVAFGIYLAIRWARSGAGGWAVPGAVTAAIVLAAAFAPVETVIDRAMAGRMTVPKLAMTVAELRDPWEHGLPRPEPRCWIDAPEGWDDRVVQFPSLKPTIAEFIAAVETQAGLEHRFASCGNGWTILWGADNITSFGFRTPGR